MNKINLTKPLVCLLIVSFALSNASCSDDSSEISDPNNNGQVPDNVIAQICTDWIASPEDVIDYMNGFTLVARTDEFLKFSHEKADYDICYEFVNYQLRTALLSMPESDDSESAYTYYLSGYKYIGIVDGAQIYSSESNNNMGMTMKRNADGQNYTVIGFAPLQSDMFDQFEPIVIHTLDSDNIGQDSFTMHAVVSGLTTQATVYFKLSETADMTSPRTYSVTSAENKATLTLTGLMANRIYYYQAYVAIDDYIYEGEVMSVELLPTPTFSVGDYYPSEDNPIGVVIKTTNEGIHGTIISLDQSFLKWDVNGIFCTDYSSYNSSDGSRNDIGTSQPFGAWVASHGTGWFGPARYQWQISKADLATINASLRKKSYPILNGFYWSSTQKNGNQSYVVTVTESGYMGYNNGYDFVHQKDNTNSVRAMKYF